MSALFVRMGTALLIGALAVAAVVSPPASGQVSSSSSAAPSSAASADSAAAARSDAEIVAAGKHIWQDAACYNCHGNNGQGGHSTDFPAGPNLRTAGLDPQSELQIIACGIPDTRMPAWEKGAYVEMPCYGAPLGPVPSGVLVSGAYTEDQIKDLVAYIQTNFMKQPMPTW